MTSNRKTISTFMDAVKSRIRSKEAQMYVEQELTYHIYEQKNRLVESGYDEKKAEALAVGKMGSPDSIGREMHRIHKPKVDWILIGLFALVLAAGTLPFYLLSFELNHFNQLGFGESFFLVPRLTAIILSLAVVALFMFLDYRKLAGWWPVLFITGLVLSFFIVTSDDTLSGRNILIIGSSLLTFWPVSLLFLFSFAGMMARLKGKTRWGMALIMIWLPIMIMMLVSQYELALFYFLTTLTVVFYSSQSIIALKRFYFIHLSVSFVFAALLAAFSQPHQHMRLMAFLNPGADLQGRGYIPHTVGQITSEAGWVGRSSGSELIGPLPEAHTDFILVSVMHELGWLAATAIIIVLGIFIYRMLLTMKKTKHPLGKMIVATGVCIIGFSVLWNIGMTLGWLPVIAISLPFISYSIGDQLVYAVFVGMILSVYRRKDLVQTTVVEKAS